MYVFINVVITRAKNRSPDMILTAFDVKVDEKNDEIPPEACRSVKKLKKINVEKLDPLKVKITMSNKWTLKKLTKHLKVILKLASDEIIICLIISHPRFV